MAGAIFEPFIILPCFIYAFIYQHLGKNCHYIAVKARLLSFLLQRWCKVCGKNVLKKHTFPLTCMNEPDTLFTDAQ